MQEQASKLNTFIRILFVDDEANQLELMKLNLESLEPSFLITTATTPSRALSLLKDQFFDCIVSDYQMSEMNGIQFCEEVRKNSAVPFVIYTGRGSEEVASAAFSAGVDDYVRKEETLAHYQVLARRIRHAVEKRRAEEGQRSSDERFVKAFNLSPFAVVMTRFSDGKYIDVNDTFLNTFGYTRSEIIGRTSLDVHIFANPNGRAKFLAVIKNGHVSDLELDLQTKTGQPVTALGYAETMNVGSQDVIIGTLVDITEHKKSEELIDRYYKRLTSVLESIPETFYELDRDWNFVYVNGKMATSAKMSPEEIIGKNIWKLFPGYLGSQLESNYREAMDKRARAQAHKVDD